jgi:hypothetical protein
MTTISKKEKEVLRKLATELAEYASLPIHQQKADMWKCLNGLEKVKPMIWMNEIPWHELGPEVNSIETTSEFCHRQEKRIRQLIYQWKYMPGDMVLEPVIVCPLVIHDTGFDVLPQLKNAEGYTGMSDTIMVDGASHFDPVIENEEDIEKIKMPIVEVDWEETELNYQLLQDVFAGILPVEKRGIYDFELLPLEKKGANGWEAYSGWFGFWFAPWDDLVQWLGVEQTLFGLTTRPAFIHKVMGRLVDAWLHRLDQYEKLNLLALNNGPNRVGSGGYGFSNQLPSANFDQNHIRTIDLWGSCAAQIFAAVSPQMHEEFALQHEKRWLERFGLTYYGCCEPLHKKISILKQISNLRKISMSPWADLNEAVQKIGNQYVLSLKPSPAIFAVDIWDLDEGRKQLISILEKTKGCSVEVIMKDISTCRNQPQRLWEWAKMAREVTEEFA